jgi:hypothetical protein
LAIGIIWRHWAFELGDITRRYRHPMHLYAAFLGGPLADGRMGEGHEVVMVVAEDLKQAKSRARAKWTGVGRGHVDAVQQIDMVDGFEITLAQAGTGDRLTLEDYN